ncbi:MAG: hypothetical protein J07HQW2_00110 [Haloquadratum walsbyi J07HQW2]|jgi:hypothetical protein|uniref:Uncharacterized protein n=2 Tax=Haloquadratum walsbyi TaxID=293091 RepID=U1PJ31_9EURY|nr:MAG: hypothetical protein J07HQW2_00110 [Haloquadratum walsbyi J07HQW2]
MNFFESLPDMDPYASRVIRFLEKHSMRESVEDQLGVDLEYVADELLGTHSASQEYTDTRLTHPYDPVIVDTAVETLIRVQQEKMLDEMKYVSNEVSEIPVELDIDDPLYVIYRFTLQLAHEREKIIEYLSDNTLKDLSGPSLEETDNELFSYILDFVEDDPRPTFVIGGGRVLRENMGNKYDFTDDELELIKYAHVEVAKQNGYDEHTLLDEIIFIPAFTLPKGQTEAQKGAPRMTVTD